MPVIATNLSASIFEEIKRHVEGGSYGSVDQFIEIAAFNQLALERGVTPTEIVERGHRSADRSAQAKAPVTARAPESPAPGAVTPVERPKVARGAKARHKQHRSQALERKRKGVVHGVELASAIERLGLASDTTLPAIAESRPRPADEHLWGQVTRLFPMKLVCRWLMRNNDGAEEWRRVDEVLPPLGMEASLLGSYLEDADEEAGRKRDELLATGLPRVGNGPSRERFLSQYVARTTRTGLYPGAITQYALATFDEDQIVLTRLGMALTELWNPVLDGQVPKATATFSEEERVFFVKQVLPLLPGELHDVTLALNAVRSGHATPDELNQVVAAQFQDRWTPIMVRTHVSGVVSRMVEMGLLRRRWEGRNVTYELGETAAHVSSESVEVEQR